MPCSLRMMSCSRVPVVAACGGEQHVDRDVVLRDLVREVEREVRERGLGGHVRLLPAVRPVPARVRPGGGDVDDASRTLLQHGLNERADHRERAEDIDVEHAAPVLRRHIEHLADAVWRDEVPLPHPRVVQQHVHRPEALHRCRERRLDMVVARDVEFERQSSCRLHDGLRLLRAVPAPREVAADDAATFVQEAVRVGAAHASRRSGDHHDLALERHSPVPVRCASDNLRLV